MKKKAGKRKRRQTSLELVKELLRVLPTMTSSDDRITQDRVAAAIGCHRHWFRRHQNRYSTETGLPDPKGLTPNEMILEFEDERARERPGSAIEVALQNADATVRRLRQEITLLEAQLEHYRKQLHLISTNRHRLNISADELFREPDED
jgi:hypothetical protein